ncbi:MAG: efflux RND transporter periplasmic adaptor subunit [Thermodesulfobacteriota bacterium]
MKRALVAVLILAVLLAGVAVYLLFRPSSSPGTLLVSGNIEVTGAEVSFEIPGRVAERRVSEGQVVTAGQVVAVLDAEELEREAALRRAEVRAAEAALAELEAGSRPEEIERERAAVRRAQAWLDELLAGSRPQEIAAAEAAVEQARAEAERWSAEYDRQKRLFEREVISAKELEGAEAAYKTTSAVLRSAEERHLLVREGPRGEQIAQARAGLDQARQALALVWAGPRPEVIEQARARRDQAREALALAETRLGYTVLAAPLSGVVLSEHVEAGEYVSPGTPVVTVGDLGQVWLRAYVGQTDLGRVHLGQRVRVTTDTYPGRTYEGEVTFLASEAEFTPKSVQTREERVKLVYRIKVQIPNPHGELKPGMPADGEILLASGE